jgi:hypothetical protein
MLGSTVVGYSPCRQCYKVVGHSPCRQCYKVVSYRPGRNCYNVIGSERRLHIVVGFDARKGLCDKAYIRL